MILFAMNIQVTPMAYYPWGAKPKRVIWSFASRGEMKDGIEVISGDI